MIRPALEGNAEAQRSSMEVTTSRFHVRRRAERFLPEHTRVITKFYRPGGDRRLGHVIDRVLGLSDETVIAELDRIFQEFGHRHRRFRDSLLKHFRMIAPHLPEGVALSPERELLLGAFFTHEYAISAAAMFNPSIVPHPDQSAVEDGALRFIMSFRAVGEGHLSSVEFRSGVIDRGGVIAFDPVSPYIEIPEVQVDSRYEKKLFGLKIAEMGGHDELTACVLDRLPEEFTIGDLRETIDRIRHERALHADSGSDTLGGMLWLATSNYTVSFPEEHGISERVLFPVSENESRGIEDARFVRFVDDDGEVTYYATYTAYNGFRILPQLIETRDFMTFKVLTLNGNAVVDKGMALFPRRVGGAYVMLGRQDGENNYIMFSEHLHFWQETIPLQRPEEPWEFIQIGNNGSPIETSHGWLVLTHGVGAMRKYCIGALLLDLDDPTRVIGRLREPLIAPDTQEREGYVPNVVYTCGAMIHGDDLIIPYAMSDSVSGIATIPMTELLSQLSS